MHDVDTHLLLKAIPQVTENWRNLPALSFFDILMLKRAYQGI